MEHITTTSGPTPSETSESLTEHATNTVTDTYDMDLITTTSGPTPSETSESLTEQQIQLLIHMIAWTYSI